MIQRYNKCLFIFLLGGLLFATADILNAQIQEPDVLEIPRNSSTLQEEYKTGLGLGIFMNNFGFGVGGEFRRVLAPQMEGTFSIRITGLRDVSEQTFTDFFFGQQVIPNKYQRAFAFPALFGLRQRLFADKIQNEYRFFVSASAGPVAAFSYPYFDDSNNNGYREQFTNNFEQVNDIFTGWKDGDWHLGGTGEVKIGFDIGSNFSRLSSIEFGYYFYYFPDGIQIMMPNQPSFTEDGQFQIGPDGNLVLEPFFDKQKFFGTPQITFVFGKLW